MSRMEIEGFSEINVPGVGLQHNLLCGRTASLVKRMSSSRVKLPILDQVIPEGVKPDTMFVVEFDPESQWFAVASTIAAEVLKNRGNIAITAFARPPEAIENDLSSLEVDLEGAFKEGRLQINDGYTATLSGGRVEPFHPGVVWENKPKGTKWLSVKVQDLSVEFVKESRTPKESSRVFRATWPAGTPNLVDSYSPLLRFNDEKSSADYIESRLYPEMRKAKRIVLLPFVRGIHTDWFYKRMESMSEGVIDIRVAEQDDRVKTMFRVRSLRGQPHDSSWHMIDIRPNGEASLA